MSYLKVKPRIIYRYNYDVQLEPEYITQQKLVKGLAILVLSIIMLIVMFTQELFRMGIIFFACLFFFRGFGIFSNTRCIAFYPRFMTIGTVIIYYENITAIDMTNSAKGYATIHYHVARKPQTFTLEQKKFPTNARKDFKIKANTRAKFEKTLERIKSQRKDAIYWLNELAKKQRTEQNVMTLKK